MRYYILTPTLDEYLTVIAIFKEFGYRKLDACSFKHYQNRTSIGFRLKQFTAVCYAPSSYYENNRLEYILIPSIGKLITLLHTGKLNKKLKLG